MFIHQPKLKHIDQNHNMIVASVRALTSIKTFSKEGATKKHILWYACPFDFRHLRPCNVFQKRDYIAFQCYNPHRCCETEKKEKLKS